MSRKELDIAEELGSIIDEVTGSCNEAMSVATRKAGRFAVRALKEFSTNKTGYARGKYSKGWSMVKRGLHQYSVVNKRYYMLTHLLENGHDIIKDGRKVGYSAPIKHIKPVEEATALAVEEYLYYELKKRGI